MSNSYDPSRGNTTDRERRKLYLLQAYAADCAIAIPARFKVELIIPVEQIEKYQEYGDVVHRCCRCYRCGKLVTFDTMTVDRIIPGCKGGRYRRDNIRPSCSSCANKQGAKLSAEIRSGQVSVVRPRVRQLAARNSQPGRDGAGAIPVPDVQAPGSGSLRRNGSVAR